MSIGGGNYIGVDIVVFVLMQIMNIGNVVMVEEMWR